MIPENGENTYYTPELCSKCGGSMEYNGVGEYTCSFCGNVEYDDYGIVRNYIEQNKGATVTEISQVTGIPQAVINRMLIEQRLQVAADSRVFLKCRGCGKNIKSGQFCPDCEKKAIAAEQKKVREKRRHDFRGYQGDGFHRLAGATGARRFKRDRDKY